MVGFDMVLDEQHALEQELQHKKSLSQNRRK